MKKILSFTLVMIMLISVLFVFTGCGEENKENNANSSENTATEKETEPKKDSKDAEISYEIDEGKITLSVPKKDDGTPKYEFSATKPDGFKKTNSFKIMREMVSNDMTLVYECRVGGAKGGHSFISSDYNCENTFNMGPMGYLYNNKVDNSIPIYRCIINSNADHFISSNSYCDGEGSVEALMGYGFNM